MSSRPELRLDWCSHEAAKYVREHWHYSGCVPHQKTVKIGIWEDSRYIGCLIFGTGANNQMLKPYGLADTEGCELVRVALSSGHVHPVSRVVSLAMRFLRRVCGGIRLVVSYADPEQGHHGGIYQAGNWIYAGMTEPADEYIVNGSRMHGRALRSTRSTHKMKAVPSRNILEWTRKVLDPNARRVEGSSKHRYLYPLDDEIRQRVSGLAKPYPKRPRVAGADSGTPADQAGGGGASPTVTLSSDSVENRHG